MPSSLLRPPIFTAAGSRFLSAFDCLGVGLSLDTPRRASSLVNNPPPPPGPGPCCRWERCWRSICQFRVQSTDIRRASNNPSHAMRALHLLPTFPSHFPKAVVEDNKPLSLNERLESLVCLLDCPRHIGPFGGGGSEALIILQALRQPPPLTNGTACGRGPHALECILPCPGRVFLSIECGRVVIHAGK